MNAKTINYKVYYGKLKIKKGALDVDKSKEKINRILIVF